MGYNGQPVIGRFGSWYVDAEGVRRNRWTGETESEMGKRFADGARTLERLGHGASAEARMLKRSSRGLLGGK